MRSQTYLSLGSNIGDREKNLQLAMAKLRSLGEVRAVSSIYETEPVEFTNQPWFLNCVIELETDLDPRGLLAGILNIERTMGRNRTVKKGPRNIDIDILLFGEQILDTPELTVPHPAMHERRFVLEPLAEIAADRHHPKLKNTVGDLLAELPKGHAVRRVGQITA